jgi:hypothetical protein
MAEIRNVQGPMPSSTLPRNWAPKTLVAALKKARTGNRVVALKRSGILDQAGKLAKKYTHWGKKVTHTPKASQLSKR